MSFKKMVEDFICEHCNASVRGDGYTNHCPKCLWSKHVDLTPGDRKETCQGMMEPVRVEGTAGKFRIVHRCQKCRKEHRNNLDARDNMDIAVSIAARSAL